MKSGAPNHVRPARLCVVHLPATIVSSDMGTLMSEASDACTVPARLCEGTAAICMWSRRILTGVLLPASCGPVDGHVPPNVASFAVPMARSVINTNPSNMHRVNLRAVLAFLLCFALTPASAVEQSLAALDPDEARRAVDLLQDEHRRDEAVLALKAIADVATSTSEPAAGRDTAAAPEQSAAETPAPEPAPAEPEPPPIVALEKDGLIARTLNEVGRWADGLGYQLGHLRQAGLELPAWYRASINTEAGRRLLMRALLYLALISAVGLALEWALRRALGRPGRSPNDHAAAAEARTQLKEEEEILRQKRENSMAEAATLEGSGSTTDAASIGKTRPPENNVVWSKPVAMALRELRPSKSGQRIRLVAGP